MPKYQTSESRVPQRGPPSTNTTPSDPDVRRNTRAPAPATAGSTCGTTMEAPRRHDPAPIVRAASTCVEGIGSSRAPTMTTTTTNSYPTWAKTTSASDPADPGCGANEPNGPEGPASARTAAPTTTLGNTNGAATSARIRPRPKNRNLASTHATGSPTTSVATVEAPAWISVTRPVRARRAPMETDESTDPAMPVRAPHISAANGTNTPRVISVQVGASAAAERTLRRTEVIR